VSKSGADIFPIKLTAGTNYKVPSNILKTRETICFRTIGSLKRERQTKWCLYIDSYSMLSAEVRAELMVSIYRLLLYETVKTMPRARKNFCFDQYEEQPKAVNDSSESGQNSIIIVIALSLSTLIFVLTTQTIQMFQMSRKLEGMPTKDAPFQHKGSHKEVAAPENSLDQVFGNF